MNYLAHAWLSFNDPAILTGNMISDFVKGKKQYDYPADIHKGIVLHRNIDSFTDAHPATARIKKVFQPHYRLYSGPFADVVYDHFLANDKNQFPLENSLKEFSKSTYAALSDNKAVLPERFAMMLPYMIEHDWLYHYQFTWGIQKSFGGLVRRAKYLSESDRAFELFNEHYNLLQECYDEFFPSVKAFAAYQLTQLRNT